MKIALFAIGLTLFVPNNQIATDCKETPVTIIEGTLRSEPLKHPSIKTFSFENSRVEIHVVNPSGPGRILEDMSKNHVIILACRRK